MIKDIRSFTRQSERAFNAIHCFSIYYLLTIRVHALAVCDARATKHFHLSAMDKKGTFADFIRLCRACNVTAKRDANRITVLETSALTERFTKIFSCIKRVFPCIIS